MSRRSMRTCCDSSPGSRTTSSRRLGGVISLVLRAPDALEPERERKAIRLGARAAGKLTDAARARARGRGRRHGARVERIRASRRRHFAGRYRASSKSARSKKWCCRRARRPKPDPAFAGPTLRSRKSKAAAHMIKAVHAQKFYAIAPRRRHRLRQDRSLFRSRRRGAAEGTQVLILLPEIALTVQFLERFARALRRAPAEWHSDLTQAQRRRNWRAVMTGDARVVVGARSALFLPYQEARRSSSSTRSTTRLQTGRRRHLSRARHGGRARAAGELPDRACAPRRPRSKRWVNAEAAATPVCSLPERHGKPTLPTATLIDMRKRKWSPANSSRPR